MHLPGRRGCEHVVALLAAAQRTPTPARLKAVDPHRHRLAIVTWIERIYHRRRRQRALGRLTPIEYETITTGLTLAA